MSVNSDLKNDVLSSENSKQPANQQQFPAKVPNRMTEVERRMVEIAQERS
jgi:hypothetical protein